MWNIFYCLFYSFNFVWLYLGSFGAVNRNTQSHLIKDALISLVLSLLSPIFFCLLAEIFRIPTINTEKKDKEFIYKISKFIEVIIK